MKIAILDTGIDVNHPNLRGIVKGGFDVTTMREGIPVDDNGHGTHIAGTICALISSAGFGLSIPAELYSVKILDRYTYGDLYNILLGLQWAITRNMDLVNLSVAYRDDSPAVRKAIEKATQAGMVLIAAVGNHSNWDAPPIGAALVGAADGGAADGGAADGGAADGGAADGSGWWSSRWRSSRWRSSRWWSSRWRSSRWWSSGWRSSGWRSSGWRSRGRRIYALAQVFRDVSGTISRGHSCGSQHLLWGIGALFKRRRSAGFDSPWGEYRIYDYEDTREKEG
ncbi:MAG: S8 family serine peptidase [Deltaproteobacteria bacterium]|nr:S8 family serine peptidase [Deltaproteobacteria bacterium]